MDIDQLLNVIKSAAFEVRQHLAPGYLESVYRNALTFELRSRGLVVECEVEVPVKYKGAMVGFFRADILVNNMVIIELKSVRELNQIHETQLVNYLTATGIDDGFLINYGGDHYRIIHKTRIYKPRKHL